MTVLEQQERSATEVALSDLERRGSELYETVLRSHLEPSDNGQVVAIHPDSGDYAVARTAPEARRALRVRQPQGLVWTRAVGPDTRYSLMRRILGARSLSQATSRQ